MLLRLADGVFGRCILALLGFFCIPERIVSLRPGSTVSLIPTRGENDQIRAGDVILANSQSPIDILYLVVKYSPVFTNVNLSTGQISLTSRWSALLHHADIIDNKSDPHVALERALPKLSSPVVIFPEGTSSNGRALLSIVAKFPELDARKIHLIGLKYGVSDGGFLPTLSLPGLGNLMKYFFTIAQQWYNQMTIKRMSTTTLDPRNADFPARWLEITSALAHTRPTTLCARDKQAFLTAYSRRYNINSQ